MATIYSFHYTGAELKFVKNRGRALVVSNSPVAALNRLRELFSHVRDATVRPRGEREFLVSFKVSLNYRLDLLKSVDKAVKMLRAPDTYARARYIDRYVVASICHYMQRPEWLCEINLKDERSALRKAAVVAREVTNIMRFVDWDIVIHNYLELNSKPGHHSRVVRKVLH